MKEERLAAAKHPAAPPPIIAISIVCIDKSGVKVQIILQTAKVEL